MSQLKRTPSNPSSLPITTQFRGMIRNNIDLLEVASKLRITPRTVRKIISGRPVSHYIRIKIQTALENDGILINPSEKSPVQHLLEINRMYQENGTLRSVGAKVGLFKYQPTKPPVISRGKILSDYRKYLNFTQVARANNISVPYLNRLRLFHKIEREDFHAMLWAGQRRKCIEIYISMKEPLGHYPTTTELQKLEKGPYLHKKILRLWGSFGAFRQAMKFSSMPMKSRI